MKKYISGLVIIFLASFANGGESKFDRELELWKRYSPKQIFLDKEHKVAGPHSIRMENGGTLQRYFTLKPDTVYELSFYVKGKDIVSSGNDGGRIMLFDGKKKWGRITSRLNSAVESGTFDWRKGSGEIKSSQWGEKIRISLAMRGKGTIWFDEVVFREIGKEEKRKTFRQIYSDDFQKLALVPGGVLGFFDPGQKVDFFIHSESRSKKLEYEKQFFRFPGVLLKRNFLFRGSLAVTMLFMLIFMQMAKRPVLCKVLLPLRVNLSSVIRFFKWDMVFIRTFMMVSNASAWGRLRCNTIL